MKYRTKEAYQDFRKYRPQSKLYIALSELDFSWYEEEVKEIASFWENGLHLADMAEKVRRDPDEVAVLLIDLARQDVIDYRRGGCFGNSFEGEEQQIERTSLY